MGLRSVAEPFILVPGKLSLADLRRLGDGAPARLVDHADVRRMLLTMKAQVEAMRALACRVAAESDIARRHPEPETRARSQEPAAMPHNVGISASADIVAVVAFSAPRSASDAAQITVPIRNVSPHACTKRSFSRPSAWK